MLVIATPGHVFTLVQVNEFTAGKDRLNQAAPSRNRRNVDLKGPEKGFSTLAFFIAREPCVGPLPKFGQRASTGD